MRKLGLRAVIAGASVLPIMSAVDGADLLGASPCGPAVRRQRGGSMPTASGPAARSPTPDGDCLHWRGPKTGGAHCWQVPAPRVNLQP